MARQKQPSEKLSEEQIEELRDAFSLFDKHGTGSISSSELRTVLHSLGKSVSEAEVKVLLKDLKVDEEGKIRFGDFVTMMTLRMRHLNREDELKEAFRIFDRNGNGLISADELRAALETFGEKMSDEELDDLLREADINGDGQIDYEEFVKMITQQ